MVLSEFLYGVILHIQASSEANFCQSGEAYSDDTGKISENISFQFHTLGDDAKYVLTPQGTWRMEVIHFFKDVVEENVNVHILDVGGLLGILMNSGSSWTRLMAENSARVFPDPNKIFEQPEELYYKNHKVTNIYLIYMECLFPGITM